MHTHIKPSTFSKSSYKREVHLTRFDLTSMVNALASSEVFLFPVLSRSGEGTISFKKVSFLAWFTKDKGFTLGTNPVDCITLVCLFTDSTFAWELWKIKGSCCDKTWGCFCWAWNDEWVWLSDARGIGWCGLFSWGISWDFCPSPFMSGPLCISTCKYGKIAWWKYRGAWKISHQK